MTSPPSITGNGPRERGWKVTRRGLFAGAAAFAATAATARSAPARPLGASPAAADDGRWRPFLQEKSLHDVTLLQAFGFDDVAERIYALQVLGTSAGDMCLNQLDYAGNLLGHMLLIGFGHGGNIGVEREGAVTYLWTETDANPSSGYGRAIARFPFAAGTTLTYGESDLVVHRPIPGSTSNQPYVDQETRRLLVRHRIDGAARYRIYDLDAAIAGDFDPLQSFDQYVAEPGESFQGFCLHRNRVHQTTGKAYSGEDGANPPSGGGNAYLATIDATTGDLVTLTKNLVAPDMVYREPEGIAIQRARSPRLVIGMASGLAGERKFSLFRRSFAAV